MRAFTELTPAAAVLASSPHAPPNEASDALQAAATQKPIFVLMSHIGYSTEAKLMLAQRAVCADSVVELTGELRSYLENKNYIADPNNDDFLKNYGNHLNNGGSLNRALNCVYNTIEGSA